MKRLAVLSVVAVVALVAGVARADMKMAYVDMQKALTNVNEGKKAMASLKAESEQKQKELVGMEQQLKAMKTDLEKQRLVLSADALKEKEQAFQKKYMELNEKMNGFSNELKQKEQKAVSDIAIRLQKIVADMGRKDGFNVILTKDAMLYGPTDSDITDKVIQAFNSGQGK